MRVWDAATGSRVGDPFTGHTDEVNAVAVGQLDGRPIVVSGSDDHTARLWYRTHPSIGRIDTRVVLDASSAIYGIAVSRPDMLAIATELGVIVVRLENS